MPFLKSKFRIFSSPQKRQSGNETARGKTSIKVIVEKLIQSTLVLADSTLQKRRARKVLPHEYAYNQAKNSRFALDYSYRELSEIFGW